MYVPFYIENNIIKYYPITPSYNRSKIFVNVFEACKNNNFDAQEILKKYDHFNYVNHNEVDEIFISHFLSLLDRKKIIDLITETEDNIRKKKYTSLKIIKK